MKIKVSIPDYFQVKHYKALTILSSLDEVEQMVHTICTITELSREEVMKWDVGSVVEVYGVINNMIASTAQAFHPIIEWKGQMYGFRNMSKMNLGEYIDLDNLCKESDKNLTSILAILYRPLTNNKIKDGKFIIKSTIKAMKYDVENVFDYYEVEEYNPEIRKQRTPEFDEFPLDIAMGALGFFLDISAMLLTNSQTYSLKAAETMVQKEMNKLTKTKQRLLNTMVGFTHSTNLLKLRSYPLQETNQLQTLT
jgi:hypothetical protein